MKFDFKKILFLILFLPFTTMNVLAGSIKGTVTDKQTKEPLTGATVQIMGTATGVVADIDGNYRLEVTNGTYTLVVKYVGYKDITLPDINVTGETLLNFEMDSDAQTLSEVSVVAKKNLENERALRAERRAATLAIENLGAGEMGIKGIGNVEEGVKKLTGISIADAGQLIVRGLGDRYSATTLIGLPIASPNPDNKLIPLDLFPSSTVQNITVSKVYDAGSFADYSGAHIDISTKENVSDDFFNFSIHTGGKLNTLGKEFYRMDRNGSLLKTASFDPAIQHMNKAEFNEYARSKDVFNTTFAVSKKSSLPEIGGNIGFGKNIETGGQTLSILASISLSNGHQIMKDAFYKTLEAGGNVLDNFDYNSYTDELKLAALAYAGYTLRQNDRIGYTFFHARNAGDTYQHRTGKDAEGYELTGSNNTTHIYTLQNHQLNGLHHLDRHQRWELNWGTSYSRTSSEEPDRRQVMYLKDHNGALSLFTLNQQETARYFGDLSEQEWNVNLELKRKWNERDFLRAGFNYKNKQRDYAGTRFYYDLRKLKPVIESIYDTDGFLNQENIANGNISVGRYKYPYEAYKAGNDIYAAYLSSDFHPTTALLLNIGLRYEISKQWVRYATDGGEIYSKRRDLSQNDLFPALNLKYTLNEENSLRFSASRTVTRPSFIEMAPFLYQESYGSAQIRGNAELVNGYNFNFDLRYELFKQNGDMLSVTGYFKYLDKPIERTQMLNGGAAIHSFNNADNGIAGGMEIEFRKELVRDLRLAANVSYMYTNVKLPEGGAYTNKERSLQGASPILANADLTYSPRFGEERQLNLALLYNLQGSRIHSVGIAGLGDVKQQAVHTLNFNANYSFSKRFSIKLQLDDLLNRAVTFKQEVPSTGRNIEVERYKRGTAIEIGASYKF